MASTSTPLSHDNRPDTSRGEVPYGSRLLPQVVDELARSNPGRIYAIIPLSSNLSQGFRDVTMLQLSQAVNKCAYWIEHILERNTLFETVSYIGPSDLRYAVVFLAAIKCGYKVSEGLCERLFSSYNKINFFSCLYHLCETQLG